MLGAFLSRQGAVASHSHLAEVLSSYFSTRIAINGVREGPNAYGKGLQA
jgi:hypothetical protein